VAIGPIDRGVLVVGGPGSGKSTLLRTLAAQVDERLVIMPADPEGAWDMVSRLDGGIARGSVLVIDDLDALVSRLPGEYAHELVERLERAFRAAGDRGILIVATVQRLAGAAARLGELLPRRIVLPTASRADHVAAGGDPAGYAPGAPPGRARIDGLAVQVAVCDGTTPLVRRGAETADWLPGAGVTGLVARRPAARDVEAAWRAAGVRIVPVDVLLDSVASTDDRVAAIGDPDEWQRHWRVLAAVRDEHTLVVDVSCGADYRALTADRAVPPYCESGRRRAWLVRDGDVQRIALPTSGERREIVV
jgi:S-DNA-T family DNA segregation ATPase FtsK/SpoIIIE